MNAKQRAAAEQARMAAHAQLLQTIEGHLAADPSSVPCLDRAHWQDWTSSSAGSLHRAAKACRACPALQTCRDYADQFEARGSGVWGGKRRGRTITEQTELPLDTPTA